MPATLSCPRCGEPLSEGASACRHCGTGVHGCPVCAGIVVDGDRFCGQCGSAQDGARPGHEPEPEPSPWDEVVERLRKATLGDFVISRELGRGGMAAVYLAHDIALNRKVAIKVMSPGILMGPGMVERFKQEAVTVANLSHPHIITIHAVRQTAGIHFFVMKLIPGRSLERIVRDSGPLPVPQVQAMLFQVGSALAYAHRRGVIHRDIKPGNILLDEDGNAIVTDFGIAKVRESPTHTMTGATVGTPAYMSPEQCWSREVTGASDQYSLGIVAYEMLTGAPPFTGPTLGILRAHVEDAPRPITEVRPDCPPEVAAAIERMLAKEPADRWPDIMHAVTGLGGRHLPEHDAMREQLAALAMHNAPPETSQAYRTPVSPVPTTTAPPPSPSPPSPAAAPPSPPPPRPSPITAVVVTAPTARGPVGEAVQLQATGRDAHGDRQSGARIRWSSSNPAVATVSPSGMVTLLAPGSVTITASSDEGVAGATLLEVTPPVPAAADVTGAPAELWVGDSAHLGIGVRDARGSALPAGAVEWSSSDPAIASVSASGVLRALAPGTATVSARVEGGLAARATVRIRPVPVASLTLAGVPGRLLPGESARLTAVARDAGGHPLTDRSVRWVSEAPTVASLAADGTVTALKEGAARVVAACEGQTAAADLRVDPAPVASLVLAAPARGVRVGRRVRLTARPLDARDRPLGGRAVRWSTEHPSLVQVDAETGEARGLAVGSAVVLAACEGIQARTTLEVAPPPPPLNLRPLALAGGAAVAVGLAVWLWPRGGDADDGRTPAVATVTLAPQGGELRAGDSLRVTASLLAADGSSLEGRTLVWESSDSGIVTVSPEGIVVARAPGTAEVVATSEGKAGRAAVRVRGPAPSGDPPPGEGRGQVAIAGAAERRVALRDTFSLDATVTDASGSPMSGAGVEWRSSRPAVATVSADGRVTAVGEGAATISATSAGRSTTITVRVTAPPVATVTVTPASQSGNVGDTVRLAATMLTAAGDTLRGKVAVWESGNPAVATVAPGGLVTIVGPGRAAITVTSGGRRGVALVTGAASRAAVATIEIAPAAERLEPGQTLQLRATPRSATGAALADRPLGWRSSRPEVATVAPDGVVSARAAGQTQITATSEAATAEVTLTVVGTTSPGGPPPGGGAGSAFRAVAAGGLTCALDPGGAAACWGQGQPTPAPVGGGRFTSITAGLGFACGLAGNGQAFCWGANGKGQLGDGTTKGRAAPTLVSADLTFSQLSAGDGHACGLTPGGNIYCWGDNGEGQLGDGSKDGRVRPTQIRESQPWKQVVAGGIHSCGLTRDGRAYCWGDGFSGELGHGMMESSLEPVPVTGGLTFTALTAGKRHSCGLTVGKEAYCWGDNRDGQLGNGGREDAAKPAAVAGELQFNALSAGAGHTCGVTAGGRAMCWGANSAGQIGDGGQTTRTAPAAARSEAVFVQISAGATHSCGVTREQAVLCWGGNSRGQLGDGSQTNRNVPGVVGGAAGRE
jgi:serine/threonine protein kinase/uncharacterized protein YjdB/alpha-tubulin suppressor-like RCC1 family protein